MNCGIPKLCMQSDGSIREAMKRIDSNRKGIVLIVDDEQKLIGTISDGDTRRAILSGRKLDSSVSSLLDEKPNSAYPKPVTASVDSDNITLLQIMHDKSIQQLPLVGSDGKVVGLVTMDDLVPDFKVPMQAVIMAGGYGSRLEPLTANVPKPMLPVGDSPLLELMIKRLQKAGISKVNITMHYLEEKITEHFGDGSKYGIELNYVKEKESLGTAGGLRLLKDFKEPLLVINGDVLTEVDFRAMLAFHKEHNADLTVAVRQYDLEVPYGVVECDGENVKKIQEKPVYNFFVNAGIYLLELNICHYVPRGKKYDMTDLIQRLIDDGRKITSFPVVEYWLDIGQHDDYKKAQEDVKKAKLERNKCL